MKKQLIVLFTLVTISIVSFTSCEPFIQNKITIRNLAAGDVDVNIRGQIYHVSGWNNQNDPVPQTVISDFKKGSFAYSTVYQVPLGATSAITSGDVAGQMNLLAGTEILLVYSSIIDSSKYTLYATLSTSDDINRVDPFNTGGTP